MELRQCSSASREDPSKPCPDRTFSRGFCMYHYRKALRERVLQPLVSEYGTQVPLRVWVPASIELKLRKRSRASGQAVSALMREILLAALK